MLRTLLVLISFFAAAHAGTIVSVNDSASRSIGFFVYGPYQSTSFGGNFEAQAFTLTQSFENVSISALLSLAGGTSSFYSQYHVRAFLTTGVGQAAPPTALATVAFTGSNTTAQSISLFNGLTLGPGTYYLVLASGDELPLSGGVPVGFLWSVAQAGSVFNGPGGSVGASSMTFDGNNAAALNYAEPWKNVFNSNNFTGGSTPHLQFQVSGDAVANPQGVPEPSSLTFCAIAAASLLTGMRFRRK